VLAWHSTVQLVRKVFSRNDSLQRHRKRFHSAQIQDQNIEVTSVSGSSRPSQSTTDESNTKSDDFIVETYQGPGSEVALSNISILLIQHALYNADLGFQKLTMEMLHTLVENSDLDGSDSGDENSIVSQSDSGENSRFNEEIRSSEERMLTPDQIEYLISIIKAVRKKKVHQLSKSIFLDIIGHMD
jgi:hypothetical protein